MDPWAPPKAVRPAALSPSTRMQSLPRQAFAGSGTVSCSPTHLSRSRPPRRAHSTLTMCTPFVYPPPPPNPGRICEGCSPLPQTSYQNSCQFWSFSEYQQFTVWCQCWWTLTEERRFASNRPSSSSSSSSNQRWAHQDPIHALAT